MSTSSFRDAATILMVRNPISNLISCPIYDATCNLMCNRVSLLVFQVNNAPSSDQAEIVTTDNPHRDAAGIKEAYSSLKGALRNNQSTALTIRSKGAEL